MLFPTNNVCRSTDLQKPKINIESRNTEGQCYGVFTTTENSQLKKQMEAKDNMLTNKDGEILRLLNQIASDMVKRSDVDEMIAAAVKEAIDKVNEENKRKMEAMAAEYEAVIASLKKKDKGGKKGGKGNSGNRKKPNTTV